MKGIATLILSFSTLMAFSLNQGEALAIFDQGNKAYEANQFDSALVYYSQLEGEFVSCEYLYNIGNTHYKLQDYPNAILYYERALKIDPRDEDLKTNLRIANQHVLDKIDELPSLGVDDVVDNLVSENTIPTWSWSALIAVYVSALLFILFVMSRSGSRRRILFFAGIFALIVGIASFALGNSAVNRVDEKAEAIIFSQKVDVLNQPEGAQIEFVLHAGTKVSIKRENNDWLEIRIANGSVGWIKKSDCEVI